MQSSNVDSKIVCVVSGHARSLVNFRGPLIKEMIKRGCKIHALAPQLKGSEFSKDLEEWGVITYNLPISRTGISPVEDISALIYLVKVLRKISPDKIFLYNIKPVIYGLLAAWFLKIKGRYAMITGLGYAFTGQAKGKRRLVQFVAKSLYKASLSKSTLVFFQNSDDKQLFKELGLLQEFTSTMVVNGSGVNIDFFENSPVPSNGFSFLMLARLLADKGVREYAQAAYKVKKEFPSVEFRLAGDFDDNPDAISPKEVKKWVEDGVIDYLGRLADVRPALKACTVYVLPSYREGTPRTVLEAMSIGRPVITTNAPGCKETVEDGVNGFLIPVASSDALYEKMVELIDHPGVVKEMALYSRKIVVEKYDVHSVNDTVLQGMGIKY